MDRRKTVYQLDTPFSVAHWPKLETAEQDTIFELLCNLLEPLGHHRRRHVKPSKGKGAKKRKRTTEPARSSGDQQVPPTPEIAQYIDVGLTTISRGLERLSSTAGLEAPRTQEAQSLASGNDVAAYSVIFVARSGQSTAFHCHFPQMVAVASRSPSCGQPIRLVGFSASCAERLSATVGIPRVSAIGLREGAPNAKALLDYVREHVTPVSVSWIPRDLPQQVEFLGTKIKAVEAMKSGPKHAISNK